MCWSARNVSSVFATGPREANLPSNPLPRLLSPQILLFHALAPPQLLLFMFAARFARTWEVLSEQAIGRHNMMPLTLCTEVALVAMVDAIPPKTPHKYVLQGSPAFSELTRRTRKIIKLLQKGYTISPPVTTERAVTWMPPERGFTVSRRTYQGRGMGKGRSRGENEIKNRGGERQSTEEKRPRRRAIKTRRKIQE